MAPLCLKNGPLFASQYIATSYTVFIITLVLDNGLIRTLVSGHPMNWALRNAFSLAFLLPVRLFSKNKNCSFRCYLYLTRLKQLLYNISILLWNLIFIYQINDFRTGVKSMRICDLAKICTE